ncbi:MULTISPECIES: thioesterase family protein [unclassified Paracoccus (in: a-proteobacteria)]|uniref:thioesterase family protein n=1 Tax=unclassified Paracoccus (in: a-proteobacteria) TaxID=2688777 RepID=UPI0021E1A675|nr:MULTISPECIES: thioesterase family protein [unclassified Paracoccus (in: a-proteobacteria)]UXU76619.1 thioesterase family protein [Paracoccus sp. SMMA_5]UXU82507.1 thioesterase family protein [Paracoccus sp. SMMA_5_TC]
MRWAAIGGSELAGWAARVVLSGHELWHHDPRAGDALGPVLADAAAAWGALFQAPLPPPGRLIAVADLAGAVAAADLILMADPGTMAGAAETLARIEAAAPASALIAVLSPAQPLSDLRRGARHPARILAVQATGPAHLLPGVEVLGAGPEAARLAALLADLGMRPVLPGAGIDTPLAPRLRAALEDMALEETALHPGGASVVPQLIDDILAHGPALDWALPGLAPGRDRDAALVGLLHALKAADAGAGQVLRAQENRFYARKPQRAAGYPLRLHQARVSGGWVDYNGHMTEFRYLQVLGDATDAFLIHIGLDADYRAGGHSAYTVETHIRHLSEVKAGEMLSVETRLLGHDAKRFRLHHSILRRDGAEVATGEHMLLHVDTAAARAVPMPPALIAALARLAAQDTGPPPDHAGRGIRPPG